jgi:hypothetical protein
MADRHPAAEHRCGVLPHGVLGQRDEVVVPSEDLRSVGLPLGTPQRERRTGYQA